MSTFLTVNEVLMLHSRSLLLFGGAPGIRNTLLLESAVMRPQNGYYVDVIQEAAALWESLSQNHPFVDGNKRTAFMATHVFLMENGYEITASPQEASTFIYMLFENDSFSFTFLDAWLRKNTLKEGIAKYDALTKSTIEL